MSFISDEGGAELKQLFFESAQELLQTLNEQGLRLEKGLGDPEELRSVRRTVHTLKGDSAACGYRELSELAHRLEDVITPELATSGSVPLAELVLTAADVFSGMLAAYRDGTPIPGGEALRKLLETVTNGPQKEETASAAETGDFAPFRWTEYEQMLIAESAGRGERVMQVRVELDQACATRGAAYQLVSKALSAVGEVLVIHPEASKADALNVIEAAVATDEVVAAIVRKCQIPSVVATVRVLAYGPGAEAADSFGNPDGTSSLRSPSIRPRLKTGVTRQAGGAAPVQNFAEPTNADLAQNSGRLKLDSAVKDDGAPQATVESTLRVDAERIDTVLNLVGELIIGKSMLHQTLSEFDRRFPRDPLRGRFSDAMAFQARVLTDLQKSVMKIRMVPVEQLFRRFPRTVRDVAKTRGREVRLETSGEGTDLDKSILEVLAEPLTHLIRNAVDHGIEPATERIAAGKPSHGTIRLNAFHQANQVVIEVSDDGRGIDRERIIAKALQNKIISADEVAQMSEAEGLELIFHPGLSTADEVTSISGRGVGMDVVKTVLDRIKGTVQIETQAGQGTTFYLKVPLTLAIIKALLFRVGEKMYAVQLAAVVEITRADESDIHLIDQHEVMQLRDEVLTLVRLGKLNRNHENGTRTKVFVIVIHLGERKFGLIVDKLVGEEELVIKALSDQLVATDLVSGASILGDGTVVLILNLTSVVSRLGKLHRPTGASPIPAQHKEAAL